MKKKNFIILSSIILGLAIVGTVKLSSAENTQTNLENDKAFTVEPTKFETNDNSEVFVPEVQLTVIEMQDLDMLKEKASNIVEVLGEDISTSNYDYKGKQMVITTLKVVDVIKGDKDLKEVKVMQTKGAEKPFKKGEKLLLFLRKNVEARTDCYNIVGTTTQGAYEIKNDTSKSANKVTKFISSNSESAKKLQLHDIDNGNNKLGEELTGNYEEIKSKLQ